MRAAAKRSSGRSPKPGKYKYLRLSFLGQGELRLFTCCSPSIQFFEDLLWSRGELFCPKNPKLLAFLLPSPNAITLYRVVISMTS